MYIINGICYAGTDQTIKVKDAIALKGGILLVTFTSGEQRLFDTTLLQGHAFKPLRDEKILCDIVIEHGVITWMNGNIDIAPEYVYENSYAYEAIDLAK